MSSFSVGSGLTSPHSLHRWSLLPGVVVRLGSATSVGLPFVSAGDFSDWLFVFMSVASFAVFLLELEPAGGAGLICGCWHSELVLVPEAPSDFFVVVELLFCSGSCSHASPGMSNKWRLSWEQCSSTRACKTSWSLFSNSPPLPLWGPQAAEP